MGDQYAPFAGETLGWLKKIPNQEKLSLGHTRTSLCVYNNDYKETKAVFKTLSLAFSRHPSPDRSPEAAAKKYRSRSLIQVRGNIFSRLNGSLSEEEHNRYIAASRDVDDLDKYINQA